MAQGKSDGTVYIDTKIDASGINDNIESIKKKVGVVSNSVRKLGKNAQKSISEIFSDGPAKSAAASYEKVTHEINELEQEYKELGKAIEKDEKLIARLQARQLKLRQIGANTDTLSVKGMDWDILEADRRISEMTPKYNQLAESISRLKAQQAEISRGVDTKRSSGQFLNLKDSLDKVKKTAGSAFLSLMKLAGNTINRGLNKLSVLFQRLVKSLIKVEKTAEKSGYSMARMLGSSILFSTVFRAINTLTTGFSEGLKALAEDSESLNNTLSSLKSNLLQLRNSFVAAFAPLIQVVVPYIEIFISYLTKALNYVSQLVAALLGQNTYKKALEVSASFKEVEESANDAKKALQGYLSPLDELNVISSKDIGIADINGGNENVFADVPIESGFKDLAQKIKDLFAGLFTPLKKAWDEVGQFVMDSWLFALDEAWKLIKDIGKDFLEVWNQVETINIFEDILRIIGDIDLTVGILLQNFREAWNYADTGKRILEAIRDIIVVITDNILHAADATVKWAKGIDFTPLLSKIQEFLSSLIPVMDSLSGIMTDFYENVILPFGEWVLEEGLPDLLQVFINFNNEVDWESLRNRLNEFWKALEPFAETVGEGLIEFIDRISDNLADFVNSGDFDDFLTSIEEWMANVNPDDVADGLENLAKALISLKIAVLGFSAISNALIVFEKLGKVFGGLGTALASLKSIQIIPFLAQLFSAMNPGMIGEIGIKISDLLNGSFLDPREWENWFGELARNINENVNSFIDNIIGPAILAVFDAIGQIITDTFNWDSTKELFEDAKKNFNKGGANIILGIVEGILGAIGLIVEPIGDFFVGLWNAFCETFGIHSPAEEMKPIGENIILGVLEGILSIAKNIDEWLMENVVNPFIDGFCEAFGIHSPSTVMAEFGVFIMKGLINGIESLVIDLTLSVNKIKDSVVKIFKEVKESVIGIWDEIVKGIKTAVNGIIGVINGMISGIVSGINNMISALNKLQFDVPDWVPEIGGQKFGLNISKVSAPQIPYLATGAVIPPNAPFMAMLGDQTHGRNLEAPEDLIRQIVREEAGINTQMLDVLLQIARSNQVIAEKELIIGDREIAKANLRGQSSMGFSLITEG